VRRGRGGLHRAKKPAAWRADEIAIVKKAIDGRMLPREVVLLVELIRILPRHINFGFVIDVPNRNDDPRMRASRMRDFPRIRAKSFITRMAPVLPCGRRAG
jgi:hypothetical protein